MAGVNREKTQKPRSLSHWCGGCDRDLVWTGKRCPTCGHLQGTPTKRLKPNKNSAALLEPLEMSYEDAFAG